MKNSKGKEVARPVDDAMEVDQDPEYRPSEVEIRDMIKNGEWLEVRRWIFSAGALEMLDNGQYSFDPTVVSD